MSFVRKNFICTKKSGPITNVKLVIKVNLFQLSHRIKKHLSMQVVPIHINTGEKSFCIFQRFESRFFSDKVKKRRDESRAAVTSKMERFVIIVNGWNPLTIITKHSIFDVAVA